VNVANTGLPDPSRNTQERWGCQVEPHGDGGPHAHIVTPIFHNNTATRWAKAGMGLTDPMLVGIIYCGH